MKLYLILVYYFEFLLVLMFGFSEYRSNSHFQNPTQKTFLNIPTLCLCRIQNNLAHHNYQP